jgi:hypothetical protein
LLSIPQIRQHTRKRIGGRDVEELHQADWCACNATYISAGCCASANGLVWEPPEFKIGELKKRASSMELEKSSIDVA